MSSSGETGDVGPSAYREWRAVGRVTQGDTSATVSEGTALAKVIAAGAPFPERVRSAFLVTDEPSSYGDTGTQGREWLGTLAAGGDEALELLARVGRSGKAVESGFRAVRLRNPRQLPSWAQSLTSFVEAQTTPDYPASSTADPTTLHTSFTRGARMLLPRLGGCIEGVEVSDEGYRDVCGALVGRLIEACDSVVRLELQLAMPGTALSGWPDSPGLDGTQAGWLARLEAFPALGFVIGVACEQWREGIVEILERLKADRESISRTFFGGAEPGPLTEFKHGAGDRHANGRSVALLRFASGRGLVYKPKDLRHVEAVMETIAFLNSAGLTPALATRAVICRDGYGWEERIDPSPVAGRNGFSRYYRRLGMLMRLMQILGGRDLWADNLLASGEQPVIVDLECLLCPPSGAPPLLPPRRQALVDRMEATVVRTAMPVQASTPSPECPARDIGCLSHAADPPELGGGALPIAEYRPWIGGETADPWNYAEDVCTGYRDMNDALVAAQRELSLPEGPLRAFAHAPMRYIWRNTSDYHRIIRESLDPINLIDGLARERVLAWPLQEASTPMARAANRPDLREIALAEVNAMRRLDVPFFKSITTSTSLFTPDGNEIAGHFADTGWDEVWARITTLRETSIEPDVAILRAAIDAARGGTELPNSVGLQQSRSSAVSRRRKRLEEAEPAADEVIEAAEEIADLLYKARLPPLGTGSGWLALLWSPVFDIWSVGPAAADLISGALGPALFLAEHFYVSGSARSWTTSRESFDELFELCNSGYGSAQNERLANGAIVPGGLAGPAALIYAAGRAAVSLGDADVLAAARPQLERSGACARAQGIGVDLPFGLAGVQLGLLRLRISGAIGDAALDSLVRHIAERLARVLLDNEVGVMSVPESARLSDLVPTHRDGVALALARTLAVAPDLVPDGTAVTTGLARHAFDCKLRGGRLAAMAVHGSGLASAPPDLVELRPGVVELSQLSTRALLLRAEEAQLAERFIGDGDAAHEAHRCIRTLLSRRAATGRWFPDRVVGDRLNLAGLDGLPALGIVLLRHVRPKLPSISLLE